MTYFHRNYSRSDFHLSEPLCLIRVQFYLYVPNKSVGAGYIYEAIYGRGHALARM